MLRRTRRTRRPRRKRTIRTRTTYPALMVRSPKKRMAVLQKYLSYTDMSDLYVFSPRHIDWKAKRISGKQFSQGQWISRKFRFPSAIYNRCYGDKRKLFSRIAKYIGKNRCFNVLSRFDKWKVYRIVSMSAAKDCLPETCKYDRAELGRFLEMNGSAILKPRYGNKGNGIYRAARTEQGEWTVAENYFIPKYTFSDKEAFYVKIQELTAGKAYIVQEEILRKKVKGRIVDFRIMLQKDGTGVWKLTTGLTRILRSHYFVSNVYGSPETLDYALDALYADALSRETVLQNMIFVCTEAAVQLEKRYGLLGELGFDIAIDESDRVRIIEVNGMPSKAIFEEFDDEEYASIVYRTPLDYCMALSRHHGQ